MIVTKEEMLKQISTVYVGNSAIYLMAVIEVYLNSLPEIRKKLEQIPEGNLFLPWLRFDSSKLYNEMLSVVMCPQEGHPIDGTNAIFTQLIPLYRDIAQ